MTKSFDAIFRANHNHFSILQRLLSKPKDFTYSELKTFLGRLEYKEETKSKTSGSRVEFVSSTGNKIKIHKPHHSKDGLKDYVITRIINRLKDFGDILG